MRILLFLLVISSKLGAQENDSLFSHIMAIKNDTERVNQLYKRGYDLRNQNPQWAFEYGKRAENEALRTHSERHIAKSYNLLGIMFYKKGKYNTALRYHKKALRLREKNRDLLGIAFSETNLGNVYEDLHLFGFAEESYLKAIENYKLLNETSRIADCLMNIGVALQHQKHFNEAIENYKMAADLTPMNDYNTKAIYLTNMAAVFVAQGKIEKGIAYNEDALKLRIMADNNLETADNYLNLSEAYISLKDFDKAKYYVDTTFYLAEQNDYFELKYRSALAYAHYYEQIKNFEQAFLWLKKYQVFMDSLSVLKDEEQRQFDFDEEISHSTNQERNLQNIWLLVTVFALLIFIPFYLIRFKR